MNSIEITYEKLYFGLLFYYLILNIVKTYTVLETKKEKSHFRRIARLFLKLPII